MGDSRITMRLASEEECGYPDEELAKEASNETERCGDLDLRECVTYDGPGPGPWEVFQLHHSDSDPFLKGTGFGDLNTYLGRPASAPLRPMTPVIISNGWNWELPATFNLNARLAVKCASCADATFSHFYVFHRSSSLCSSGPGKFVLPLKSLEGV
ncbi:hypothetical protein JHK85_015304 [Glycine max]|nr:hypothetical protein JHK85_015304 [Glycine max]